jgi:hypoxanthine phosphoribosyltransferase
MIDYKDILAEVLIPAEKLQTRIGELGEQISWDYKNSKDLLLVCILGAGIRESSGHVRITLDLISDIHDKDVLIIEDIIDSGRTLASVLEMLSTREPHSLNVCTLLDKHERREVPVDIKYVGFSIPNKFVFGYGLDLDEHYRNLPFIGVVDLGKYHV